MAIKCPLSDEDCFIQAEGMCTPCCDCPIPHKIEDDNVLPDEEEREDYDV